MKITGFHLPPQRNDGFFQYITRVRNMTGTATSVVLKVEAVYGEFNRQLPFFH